MKKFIVISFLLLFINFNLNSMDKTNQFNKNRNSKYNSCEHFVQSLKTNCKNCIYLFAKATFITSAICAGLIVKFSAEQTLFDNGLIAPKRCRSKNC